MKVELHILQNFAPSNLNRDDTGAPKDCELGGVRRARISSQCLKRAMREVFRTDERIDTNTLAVRTKRLVDEVVSILVDDHERDPQEARERTRLSIQGGGFGFKQEEDKTQYLIFMPRRQLRALANLVQEHWNELSVAPPTAEGEKKGKKNKKSGKSALSKELVGRLQGIFEDSRRSPDLALFGRMIADSPEWNVDAACQVAHAISTHRVNMDFDFFTAVDDLKPEDTAGSDMMGTVQFNSACYYRYLALDLSQLAANLGEAQGSELERNTLRALLHAVVRAIPSGKQNSMAAHNPPSYVLAVVRERGPTWSLANAFTRPVRATPEQDVISRSIAALETYFEGVHSMLGSDGIRLAVTLADRRLSEDRTPGLNVKRVSSFDELSERVVENSAAPVEA